LRAWRADRKSLLGRLFRLLSGSSREKLVLISDVYPIFKGIPGEDIVTFAYFKSRKGRPHMDVDPARDGMGLIWLAVSVPLTGKHTEALLNLCEPVFHRHGFDLSVTFIMV